MKVKILNHDFDTSFGHVCYSTSKTPYGHTNKLETWFNQRWSLHRLVFKVIWPVRQSKPQIEEDQCRFCPGSDPVGEAVWQCALGRHIGGTAGLWGTRVITKSHLPSTGNDHSESCVQILGWMTNWNYSIIYSCETLPNLPVPTNPVCNIDEQVLRVQLGWG